MFSFGDFVLWAGPVMVGFTLIFTVKRRMRQKPLPKLIPIQPSRSSFAIDPEATRASEFTEWALLPPECFHHLGYLKNLPWNEPVPSECLNCYKVVECLGSWKLRNA